MPGALPAFSPSMASATAGPRPSALRSVTGYWYVLNENRMARVLGSRVSVWSSTRSRACKRRDARRLACDCAEKGGWWGTSYLIDVDVGVFFDLVALVDVVAADVE